MMASSIFSSLTGTSVQKNPILPVVEPPKAALPQTKISSAPTLPPEGDTLVRTGATQAEAGAKTKSAKLRSCMRGNWKTIGIVGSLAIVGRVVGGTVKKFVIDPQNAQRAARELDGKIVQCLGKPLPDNVVSLMHSADPASDAACGIMMRDGKTVGKSTDYIPNTERNGFYTVHNNFYTDAEGNPLLVGITDKSSTTFKGKPTAEWDTGQTSEIPCVMAKNTDETPGLKVSGKVGDSTDWSVWYDAKKPVYTYEGPYGGPKKVAEGDAQGKFTFTDETAPPVQIYNLRGFNTTGKTYRDVIDTATKGRITVGDASMAVYARNANPNHRLNGPSCAERQKKPK